MSPEQFAAKIPKPTPDEILDLNRDLIDDPSQLVAADGQGSAQRLAGLLLDRGLGRRMGRRYPHQKQGEEREDPGEVLHGSLPFIVREKH